MNSFEKEKINSCMLANFINLMKRANNTTEDKNESLKRLSIP